MTTTIVDREPVRLLLAGLTGVVAMGLAVAVGFGWLEAKQATAIVAFVTTATALASPLIRGAVFSPATVAALTEVAPALHA